MNLFELFPYPNYLFMRPFECVDTDIFTSWSKRFVENIFLLLGKIEKILLIFDGNSS